MKNLFYLTEIRRPEDVIEHLAEGQRHWRKGFSAYELAYSWVESNDIPAPVRAVLDTCHAYEGAELVEGFFEREVKLRSHGRPSQTDLMALVKLASGYGVIAVEGKVEEPFGPLVSDWNDGSQGKMRRLGVLCETLGLEPTGVTDIRYQLIHRTASAIYEAQRYRCGEGLMLVHSFSRSASSLDDFLSFADMMGTPVSTPDEISSPKVCEGVELRLGWVQDAPRP